MVHRQIKGAHITFCFFDQLYDRNQILNRIKIQSLEAVEQCWSNIAWHNDESSSHSTKEDKSEMKYVYVC